MMKSWSRMLPLLIAIALPWAARVMAADAPKGPDGVDGRLVSAAWLMRNLERGEVVILDASPAPLYAAQHIPGAVNVDVFSYGGRETALPEMERRMQVWSISPGRKIVVVDPGASFLAPRLFYDLHYHGVPAADLYILDGGMAQWLASGGRVTKEPTPAPVKGSFRITQLNEGIRVRLPEFLVASGDPRNNALVEALDASWYFGETAFFDRAGHVPNATMLPSADFFNADKTFKSAHEMRRMLGYLGIQPEQQIYTYCGGGVAAATPYFVLKHLLDYPKVKLYRESQMGWLSDERGLPMWTYSAPYQMRDTQWLKTWGGKMSRMYGISQVSIVDVRSPEAYGLGHVPFAINIPAEVFRRHLREPDKLAALLGPSGVNAAHEAVVHSDNGLDQDAALAYLTLTRLGQAKVSVFVDTLERWAELGQEVTREPTSVGEKKSPTDMPIARTTYSAKLRGETLITDAQSTAGVYPKVFVATSKKPPAKMPAAVPAAAVVHAPYTALVNSDGKPRAAKEIWNALAKAGVPRYAEIVLVADDPAEAAAGYFIFKLMGFPDVKALAP